MNPIDLRKKMGIVISYLVAIIGLITLVSCAVSLENERQESQRKANRTVSRFQYIKDPRTYLCFAYFIREGGYSGGPALATVPCEAIPPELLIIANLADSKK